MGKYHKGIGENSIGIEKYSVKYRKTIAVGYSKAASLFYKTKDKRVLEKGEVFNRARLPENIRN